ncbi:DUF1905 domain-containing protein [Cellulomonas marina]|uniref:DUF1905 domain-containing protein n=1 Tax=Cellulomonas marina TaxID=988821 RepID=A0A1I0V2E8_9CELL|nr:DUF1905 domain-containing protein [Cellulomonas marina]GIG28287.1 hypothetical protein Cma02nite_08870 [Cellulomonas marina]SFA70539.1 protein of unknown function [Cellulomonas marina]
MELEVAGEVVHWRGPAPYHFLVVPEPQCAALREAAERVSYGWGMVPVTGVLGATRFTTSLWPRAGGYVVPLKDAVRRAEGVELGDEVVVRLLVDD